MMRTISDNGLAFIRSHEGLRLSAYTDSAGVWTIGYGHTSMAGPPKVKRGDKITAEDAESILRRDVDRVTEQIRAITPGFDDLPQPVFDAIVSFVFNVGLQTYHTGGRPGSRGTVWRGVVAKDPMMIARGLRLYNKASAKDPLTGERRKMVLKGLVKRREAEAKMVEEAIWTAPLPPDVPAPLPPVDKPVDYPIPNPNPEPQPTRSWGAWAVAAILALFGLLAAFLGHF